MSDEQPRSRREARAAQAPPKKAGLMAVVRRHPTAWLFGSLAVAFVLLATGSVFAGMAVASPHAAAAPSGSPSAAPRATPSAVATPSRLRTCSVASLAADPRLMTLEGSVMRVDTGEVLFDHNAANPAPTASLMKVLIAAAAVDALGPDFQIATDVVDGSAPGTVVLIGHGDATLSATGPGQESVYTGAPKLSDLAAQTVAQYASRHPGVAITQVILDSSYWSSSDAWDPDVKTSERTQGYQSLTTALQVDGDRQDPTQETSPRGSDPVADAGAAFVAALKSADPGGVVANTVTTTDGTAISGSAQLAEVKSQPLRALLPQMLLPSDNTLGEMLARVVSKVSGNSGSAASLQQAIPTALAPYKLPTTGLTIRDGSGESPKNAVPAATMSQLMIQVQAGSQNLDVVRDALPVAGKSGSLATRFTGANAPARGHVTAKTGWIDTEYSISGFLSAADGTNLAFTFYAIGDGIKSSAQSALDSLTMGVFTCGDNLSNN